jgi:DNA-binding MarR family transcriptional regulator
LRSCDGFDVESIWRASYRQDQMPKPIPKFDRSDPAVLFQRLIGVANRETAGQSTLFMYESGLTFPQIIAMYVLTWQGPQPLSALAEALRLSLAATSQLVDRLVEGEYVARGEQPEDRRVRIIRMRARGKRFMDRLNEIRRQELSQAFNILPPPVRERLTDALREAVEALSAGDSSRDTD